MKKKEAYYFSHDSNALTDTKILNMRADYGLEGYGLYWVIIEMMRDKENYKLELNKNTYRAIKTLTNTDIDVEKYINDCIEDYKLFEKNNNEFYSNSFLKRMKQYEDKKTTNKQNGMLGGRPKQEQKTETKPNNNPTKTETKPNDNPSLTEKNQRKGKEKKGNEIKGKESKENNSNSSSNESDSCDDGSKVNDSCDDGLQEVIDFYNNNVGLITPYGLEVLEDYTKEMSSEVIIYAMQKAVEADARSLSYIKGTLNNWSKKGIKTLLEAKKENELFRNSKQTKQQNDDGLECLNFRR